MLLRTDSLCLRANKNAGNLISILQFLINMNNYQALDYCLFLTVCIYQVHPWFNDVNLFSFLQGVIVNCSLTIVSTFSNTLRLLSVHHPSDNQFSFQPTSPYMQLLPYQKIEVKMCCFSLMQEKRLSSASFYEILIYCFL